MTEVGRGRGLPAGGWADLRLRVVSAVAMAAAAVATAWVGGPIFGLFWLLAAAAVTWEWNGLVGAERTAALFGIEVAALAAAAFLASEKSLLLAVAALGLGVLATMLLSGRARRAVTGLGLFYAGVLAFALPLLRGSDVDGLAVILWLFAVVWGTDTMALFGGRAIGGPKLAPRLSPSKTWSGFAVGVASGALLGFMVAPRSACSACVVTAGLAVGAAAQAGDLFESALKRRFGVKDAGSLIPGHGGVMDRLDGFIVATALAAVVGLWRFGPDGAGAGLLRW